MHPKISIAEPCHENWDSMTPSEKGRFCSSCEKTVHDVAHLSNKEIIQTYNENGDTLCIRIPKERLYDHSKPVHNRWWIAALIFLVLGVKNSFAKIMGQNNSKWMADAKKDIQLDSIKVRGTVMDTTSAKEPLPFATVQIMRGNKMLAGGYSDLEGKFSFTIIEDSLYRNDTLTLKVSYIGYKTVEKKFAARPTIDSTIYIDSGTISLDEIIIMDPRQTTVTTGIMILGKMTRNPPSIERSYPILDEFDTKTYRADEIEHYNFGRD